MENRIAQTNVQLAYQVRQAIGGLTLHGAAIGITMVNASTMTAKLAAFIAGENDCTRAKAKLSTDLAEMRSAVKEVRDFASAARDVLKPYLGKQYSSVWDAAGFVRSLAIARSAEDLGPVMLTLADYFKRKPQHENAPLNITQTRALELYNRMVASRNTVNVQTTTLGLLLESRNEIGSELRQLVRMLLKELSVRLKPTDEHYTSFGFNKPGQKATPQAPENVTVKLIRPDAATVKWEKAPRAKYYRVWIQVEGVNEEPVVIGRASDPDFMMEGLPLNSQVAVGVTAVNRGGESVISMMTMITTPIAQLREEVASCRET